MEPSAGEEIQKLKEDVKFMDMFNKQKAPMKGLNKKTKRRLDVS